MNSLHTAAMYWPQRTNTCSWRDYF